MLREVLQYPHPLLHEQAKEIPEITPHIRRLAADMLETMYKNDGIGLAAPQIGELVRLIVVDTSGPDRRERPLAVINPVLQGSGDMVDSEEGCLSVCDYRSVVKRFSRVKLEGLDLNGAPLALEVDADGDDASLAVCLQHECDHLDGKLFIDRISRLKRGLYDAKVKKWIKSDG
jgi:peptide deformylase